jgi:hypothetical protein
MQTMTDTKRTLVRDMPNRSRVVATLDIGRGYFSLTGELYEPHGTWSGRARHGERARARLGRPNHGQGSARVPQARRLRTDAPVGPGDGRADARGS